jgi:hypothetical protein
MSRHFVLRLSAYTNFTIFLHGITTVCVRLSGACAARLHRSVCVIVDDGHRCRKGRCSVVVVLLIVVSIRVLVIVVVVDVVVVFVVVIVVVVVVFSGAAASSKPRVDHRCVSGGEEGGS